MKLAILSTIPCTYAVDYPAATWMKVYRLFMRDARLDVELIAPLPK